MNRPSPDSRFGENGAGGANPSTAKLSVSHLNFYYGSVQALHDISLEIPPNRITALIGPSGCGKSTFLRTLNRMHETVPIARTEGTVSLDGRDIFAEDVTVLRRKIGMVFQRPNPFVMSIYQNLTYGLNVNGIRGKRRVPEIVESCLQRAALWDEVKDRLHKSAHDLSGGQQQRLCIARALAVDPDVILLDEPCSALDPVATAKIEELLLDIKRERTIVIVTHNMYQAARVSDFTGFFLMGKLIEHNPTELLFKTPTDAQTEAYITGRYG